MDPETVFVELKSTICNSARQVFEWLPVTELIRGVDVLRQDCLGIWSDSRLAAKSGRSGKLMTFIATLCHISCIVAIHWNNLILIMPSHLGITPIYASLGKSQA